MEPKYRVSARKKLSVSSLPRARKLWPFSPVTVASSDDGGGSERASTIVA